MNDGERAMLVGAFKRGDVAVLRYRREVRSKDFLAAQVELAKVTERTGVEFVLLPVELEVTGPPADPAATEAHVRRLEAFARKIAEINWLDFDEFRPVQEEAQLLVPKP